MKGCTANRAPQKGTYKGSGEHHQRHHTRFQQRDVIAETALRRFAFASVVPWYCCVTSAHSGTPKRGARDHAPAVQIHSAAATVTALRRVDGSPAYSSIAPVKPFFICLFADHFHGDRHVGVRLDRKARNIDRNRPLLVSGSEPKLRKTTGDSILLHAERMGSSRNGSRQRQ